MNVFFSGQFMWRAADFISSDLHSLWPKQQLICDVNFILFSQLLFWSYLHIWSWPSAAARGLRFLPPEVWSAERWSRTRCPGPGGRSCAWSCPRAAGRTWCPTQCGIPPPCRWWGRPRWCCWRSAGSRGRWRRRLLAEAAQSAPGVLGIKTFTVKWFWDNTKECKIHFFSQKTTTRTGK